ncbi:hypothetical protein QJS10_CPA06g00828 [Acorus calamus]|uniref:Tryptophan--tRNA ligase n=1 Tax=Acorus calamus TaxID=4465 RepID=A0AAV9EM92_ACOCL|nr:hypothetical protein QJS10_CPA06g00828 [Acorus calamus]
MRRSSLSFRCLCSVSGAEMGPSETATAQTPRKKRVVSGVQPTGSIHLGNYLGAIKNWVSLQITLPYDAPQLSKTTRSTAAIYLACGIDTSKGDENVGVALLTYPVLMASDILLYQSDLVPVGDDQKQHLELTRELAERINYLYGRKKWKKMGGLRRLYFYKNKGIPWTEEEHKMFLVGLKKLGKGDWRGIARNYVVSRTPTQVASHAQKYFIRQTNSTRRKRRSSLFDMVAEVPAESQSLMEKKYFTTRNPMNRKA